MNDILSTLMHLGSRRVDNTELMHRRFVTFLRENSGLAPSFRIIKVAGTNGKGSVAAMLAAALSCDGKRTGVFTSPHLQRISERIQITGMEIDDADLICCAEQLHPDLEAFVQRHGTEYQLSFFEMLVIISLRLFEKNACDFAVYEAGIGGASDCTANLPAVLSVITNIARDHHDKLGPTLEDIAVDKAGIADDGSTLQVGSRVSDHLYSRICDTALNNHVKTQRASSTIVAAENLGFDGWNLTVALSGNRHIHRIELPLMGQFQLDNFELTLACVEFLTSLALVSSASCIQGVQNVRWPGRLEHFGGGPRWILDVASNEHALQAVAAAIRELTKRDRCIVLYGTSDLASIEALLPIIESLSDHIAFVGGFYRSVPATSLSALSDERGRREPVFESPRTAMGYIREKVTDAEATVIGCGSLFLVGALRELLLSESPGQSHDSRLVE